MIEKTKHPIKNIGVFIRKDGKNQDYVEKIVEKLFYMSKAQEINMEIFPFNAEKMDMIIAVGGDGTFLKASHTAFCKKIPVTGINAGRLGFLTEIKKDEYSVMNEIIRGKFKIQKRTVLSVTITSENNNKKTSWNAINELVVQRANEEPMMDFSVFYNNQELSGYKADGLIICTPTGSTAYNLSLNGPVLYPSLQNIVINAIAPHALTHRPIVLPGNTPVELHIKEGSTGIAVTDGLYSIKVAPGDRIFIKEAENKLFFIGNKSRSFFSILNEKLKFGIRT